MYGRCIRGRRHVSFAAADICNVEWWFKYTYSGAGVWQTGNFHYDDDLLSDVLLFAEAALSSSFGTTGFRGLVFGHAADFVVFFSAKSLDAGRSVLSLGYLP